MSPQFSSLRPVPLELKPFQRLPRPASASWNGVCLCLGGDGYTSYFEEDHGSTVLSFHGDAIPLKPPGRERFLFPEIQRFSNGDWLVVEIRTVRKQENAFVLKSDGGFSHSFYAGDGISHLCIDSKDRIWVGYFDEGVYGSDDEYYGKNGLVRLNSKGTFEFGFNKGIWKAAPASGDPGISDIYALALDDWDRAWVCPYTDFYLAFVENDEIHSVLDNAPVKGAGALMVGHGHIAFFGGYGTPELVTVMDRQTLRLRTLRPTGPGDQPLAFQRISARGVEAAGLADDELYRWDMELLLAALGPWNDKNSATLESALMQHAKGRRRAQRSRRP